MPYPQHFRLVLLSYLHFIFTFSQATTSPSSTSLWWWGLSRTLGGCGRPVRGWSCGATTPPIPPWPGSWAGSTATSCCPTASSPSPSSPGPRSGPPTRGTIFHIWGSYIRSFLVGSRLSGPDLKFFESEPTWSDRRLSSQCVKIFKSL